MTLESETHVETKNENIKPNSFADLFILNIYIYILEKYPFRFFGLMAYQPLLVI